VKTIGFQCCFRWSTIYGSFTRDGNWFEFGEENETKFSRSRTRDHVEMTWLRVFDWDLDVLLGGDDDRFGATDWSGCILPAWKSSRRLQA
jgi:hypothetical protein